MERKDGGNLTQKKKKKERMGVIGRVSWLYVEVRESNLNITLRKQSIHLPYFFSIVNPVRFSIVIGLI